MAIPMEPFVRLYGFDRGNDEAIEEMRRTTMAFDEAVRRDGVKVPFGRSTRSRWAWGENLALYELWPSLDEKWFMPSYLVLYARWPKSRGDLLTRYRSDFYRRSDAPLPRPIVATCAPAERDMLFGFRRTAAARFLDWVFGAGVAVGWQMHTRSPDLVALSIGECDSILLALARDGLIRKGEYAPHPTQVRTPASGLKGYRQFDRSAYDGPDEGDRFSYWYAQHMWHAVPEKAEVVRRLYGSDGSMVG